MPPTVSEPAQAQKHASAFFDPPEHRSRSHTRNVGERCARSHRARLRPGARIRVGGVNILNNRYHDPTTGTFLSVDPLVGMTGMPYLYGDGNPVTFSDPNGLCAMRYDGMFCASQPNKPKGGKPAPGSGGPGTNGGGSTGCTGGLSSSACLAINLPPRHVHLLGEGHSTDVGSDPTGRIKIFGLYTADEPDGNGNPVSRQAEVRACAFNPLQCATMKQAADYVNALLPDQGDGTQNNAERHALISAFYWLMANNKDGPDAHENIMDGQLDGYLESYRMMDLINNEVGMQIAESYSGSAAYTDSVLGAPLLGADYDGLGNALFAYGGQLPAIPADMQVAVLGMVQQASSDQRLVWVAG